MKRLVAALVLVLCAMSSLAAERRVKAPAKMRAPVPQPATNLQQDPGDGGGDGGSYSYCVARSSLGQKCRDLVTVYTSAGTLCANGCEMCASVRYSASCSCNSETNKLTGKCTYW